MTLHKGQKPARGLYLLEVQEFLNSGYDSAWTDLYSNKNSSARIMGFRVAIEKLDAPVTVSFEHGKIWLERKNDT